MTLQKDSLKEIYFFFRKLTAEPSKKIQFTNSEDELAQQKSRYSNLNKGCKNTTCFSL